MESQLSGKPVGLDALVFCRQDGRPLDALMLTHGFHDIARRVGLENVRFHDLRHTFGLLALLRGAGRRDGLKIRIVGASFPYRKDAPISLNHLTGTFPP